MEEPRMVFELGRFVFLCSYEERRIPKGAHFYWDPLREAWATTSYRCAARLIRYADQDAKGRIIDRLGVGRREMPERGSSGPGRFGNKVKR